MGRIGGEIGHKYRKTKKKRDILREWEDVVEIPAKSQY